MSLSWLVIALLFNKNSSILDIAFFLPLRVLREPPVNAIKYVRDSIAQIVQSFRYLNYSLLVSQIIRNNTWNFRNT